MAAHAERRSIEFRRSHIAWVGRMLRLRAVAGLTVDTGVLAGFLSFEDIDVTSLTRVVSGKAQRTGDYFSDCSSAVVTILAKGGRHNVAANAPEDEEGNYEQRSKPEEMSSVFQEVHPPQSSLERPEDEGAGSPM